MRSLPLTLTPGQLAAAREQWSGVLKLRQLQTREAERCRVVVDNGEDE